MNKKDVQKRVSQHGKPLALSMFTWCEKTLTFSTDEDNCVIDFNGVNGVTIVSGSESTQTAGEQSTQTAGSGSTQTAGSGSTQKAGEQSTQTAGLCSTQKAGLGSTQEAKWGSTQTAGWNSTQTAGEQSTQTAGWGSTQTAGEQSTQTAGWGSTHICNGKNIAIIRSDVFEVMQPNEGDVLQSCPSDIEGFVVNGIYNGKPHIVADGILSEIVHQKGDVYTVINYGETKKSYIVKQGDIYSHGATVKQARESLIYKISDRDVSDFENLTLDDTVSHADAIQMYRAITGACEKGVRYFVESNDNIVKDEYTVKELLDLTKGQYAHDKFKAFFEGGL